MALSRKEVMEQYKVDKRGIIRDPGKMEGNPLWVPALWDQTMESGEDETVYDGDTPISVFYVGKDDTDEFPELAKYKVVTLYEDSQGFVQWNGYKTEVDYTRDAEKIARDSAEAEGPVDDDFVTSDGHRFYKFGYSSRRPVVEVEAGEDPWPALRAYMDKHQWWPNVWMEEERGGWRLMTED